uniref:Uncharacterized protein n=1 Tax=Sphaerodactylus townsendi TaxID=933632 RepID=A0ACB8FH88_9SAUR
MERSHEIAYAIKAAKVTHYLDDFYCSGGPMRFTKFGWLVTSIIVHWAGVCLKKSGWGEHLGLDTSVDIIRWLAETQA